MIIKFICFVLGHKVFRNVFTGKYATSWSFLHGEITDTPIMRKERLKYCDRCGNELFTGCVEPEKRCPRT